MEHRLQRSNETLNIPAPDYMCTRMSTRAHAKLCLLHLLLQVGCMFDITCGASQRGRPPTCQRVKEGRASRTSLVGSSLV
jgi:hypothetical protein